MDQRERHVSEAEAVQAAIDGRQAEIWTVLPGIIESFDAVAQTAVVQPALRIPFVGPSGEIALLTMPLLLDCPVEFPGGGGMTLTFPVQEGDECTVKFASRCIDGWWQSGGIQAPAEWRMHDLSDGFAQVGVRSQPRRLANVSTVATELRSDDNTTKIAVDPTAKTIVLDAPGGATLAANVTINGNLQVNGNFGFTGTGNFAGTGGAKVARVGDTVSGGVITSGSSSVKAN